MIRRRRPGGSPGHAAHLHQPSDLRARVLLVADGTTDALRASALLVYSARPEQQILAARLGGPSRDDMPHVTLSGGAGEATVLN